MASEKSNVMNNNQLRNASSVLSSTSGPQLPFNVAHSQAMATPPPLPPRQTNSSYSGYNGSRPFGSSYGGYNNYNSYGSYGNNFYRGYNNYGSLGGYMSYSNPSCNFGPFGGHSGDVENRFAQYAEESTRSTLQLVETVLHTFSSFTMMLESTYFAMTNSLNAILSVAENVTRLKSTIGQILSTLTLIRFVKWIYRKLLSIIGMARQYPIHEDVWRKSVTRTEDGATSTSSSWTGCLFFSLFLIIPYLIHKISVNVKQIQTKGMDPKEWFAQDDPVYSANVLYDFVPTSNEDLAIKAGQKIWLAPQSLQPKNMPGWLMATDSVKVGLVPYNYITVVGQLRKKTDLKNSRSSESASTSNKQNAPLEFANQSQNGSAENTEQFVNNTEDDVECSTKNVS